MLQSLHDRHAPAESSRKTNKQAPRTREVLVNRSIRRHLVTGSLSALVLIGCIGGWSAWASISSAVIASGQVAVESNIKLVQHAEGGIVGEIAVRNGERIRAGDVLMRMDGTATRANLAIIVKRMDELSASMVRLTAERDGTGKLVFPPELGGKGGIAPSANAVDGQRALFHARRETLSSQVRQLEERVAQTHEEITGLTSQRDAKARELQLAEEELGILAGLKKKDLVPVSKYIAAQRGAASLQGEHGRLVAEIARAGGRISETQLQIIQMRKEFRESVLSELRTTEAELSELSERRIAAEDQLRRLEIRAPQAGMVHQLAVHTIGAVITPGQELMQIVPQDEELIVEAKVLPADIDQVHIGQQAKINFTAFNQRTTPQLQGTLYSIAADLTEDERSGLQYYIVRLRPTEQEMTKLGDVKLTPGMPADVFVQTGARSALSYLTKPFVDQLNRAFREE